METQVKERLTGAVILVTLFVLLVPELLTGGSGRAAPQPEGASDAAPGEPAVRTYSIDLVQGGVKQEQAEATDPDLTARALKKGASGDPDATVEPAKAAAEQVAAQPQPLAATVVKPGAASAGTPEKPTAEKPVPAAVKSSPPADAARLAKADENPVPAATTRSIPPPVVERASRSAPPATERVSRAAPAATATRSSASASSVAGWAVQLGSFASRDNAQRLVKQLKGKGYSAFVLAGGGSSGKLYRVRVGPEHDRTAASALAAKLRAAGHKGSVVSNP